MKKIGLLLILSALALVLIITLAGCGTKEPASTQSSTPSTSIDKSTTSSSTPTAPQPPNQDPVAAEQHETTVAQPSTSDSTAVTPADPTPSASDSQVDSSETFSKSVEALQALSSYRHTTVMKYEGTEGSVTESSSMTIIGEYSAPDRYHMTMIDSDEGKQTEFIKIGDSMWVKDEGEWAEVPEMAVAAMSQSIFNFGLNFVWGQLASGMEDGANFVGRETVNGIKSRHYSSTNSVWERQMDVEFSNSHGDVWIAEAGYPVKFVFTASGTDEDGNSGAMEWRSDVTDINKEVIISAPATPE